MFHYDRRIDPPDTGSWEGDVRAAITETAALVDEPVERALMVAMTTRRYPAFNKLMTDASLPDQTGIETVVQDQCLPAFQAFVGLAYQDSVLEVSYLAPTQDSWDAGDRELLCLIYDPSGDVTGSLAGANR